LQYNFEWDINKAKLNIKKHSISFELASTVFTDSRALTIYDQEHSEDEERWVTIGMVKNTVIVVVCHTYTKIKALGNSIGIRIISARKATRKEKVVYLEG
jgi:uncharacterized DUF497 family protein